MSLCFASSGRRRRISPLAGSAVLRDSPLVWFSSILQEISKCLFRSPNRIVVDVPRPRSDCSGSVFLRWLTPLVRKALGCISLSARCLLTVSFGVNGEYLQFFSKCARYPQMRGQGRISSLEVGPGASICKPACAIPSPGVRGCSSSPECLERSSKASFEIVSSRSAFQW